MAKRKKIQVCAHGLLPLHVSIQTDPDGNVDAMYFKFRRGRVARTVEFSEWTLIDLDKEGDIVGVEMLEPGMVTRKELERAAKKYREPSLATLNPKSLLAGVGI